MAKQCTDENTEKYRNNQSCKLHCSSSFPKYTKQTLKNETSQYPSKAYMHLHCYLTAWKTNWGIQSINYLPRFIELCHTSKSKSAYVFSWSAVF